MDSNNYMITNKISKLIAKFSIPSLLSVLLSQLYTFIDLIFVNNIVGYNGGAALGLLFPLICFTYAISQLFGDGAATNMALSMGLGNTKKLHVMAGNSILLCGICSLIFVGFCYLGGDWLLTFLGSTNELLVYAKKYAVIIYAGFPFSCLQGALVSILRVDGQPRKGLIVSLIGTAINMILDPILITVFSRNDFSSGMYGAALATIIGQFVSCVILFIFAFKFKNFRLRKSAFKIDFRLISQSIKYGFASFLTQVAFLTIGIVNNIVIVNYAELSRYGAAIAISSFVIAAKVNNLIASLAVALVIGMMPVISYNYGAGKIDRVKKIFKILILYVVFGSGLFTAFFEFFPSIVINFLGSSSELLFTEFATKCLRIYASLTVFCCFSKACCIFLQSLGKAKIASILSFLRDVFSIIIVIVIPCFFQGEGKIESSLYSAPIADILTIIIVLIFTISSLTSLKSSGCGVTTVFNDKTFSVSTINGTIITISREHGVGGDEIARRLSEKLGIPVYNKQQIVEVATKQGVNLDLAESFIGNTVSMFRGTHVDLVITISNAFKNVYLEVASKGSCILIDRASDFYLKGSKNLIRVFIYGEMHNKIDRVRERFGLTVNQAKKQIINCENARAKYYETVTGQSWREFNNYDLCLSTNLGSDKIVDLIVDNYEKLNKKGV